MRRFKTSFSDYVFPILSHRDKAILYRQFATILSSGLNYKTMMQSFKPKSNRQEMLANHMRAGLRMSKPLSELMRVPAVFPNWHLQWVAIGEKTGMIDVVFQDLASQEEASYAFAKKVQKLSIRPKISFVLMVFLIHLKYLVLGEITTTQYLIKSTSPLALCIVAYLLIVGVIRANSSLVILRRVLEGLAFRLPIVKTYLIHKSSYRFTTSFLKLYGAGLPIFDCIQSSAAATGLVTATNQAEKVVHSLRQGAKLENALRIFSFITPMAIGYVTTGQKTGNLDKMFGFIQAESESKIETSLKRLVVFISVIFEISMVVFVFV